MHDVYLLLKLEDKCHLWITDFLSCCECGGGAVRCLVVNVSGRGYSPGRKTLIAFSAVLGWMEHIMWHFLSFSPSLSSLTPSTPSITPGPRLRLIWSSLHRRNTHGHMRAFTSADMDQLTAASPLSACQWSSVLGDYLTLPFSQVTPQSLGWTEVMNEWSIDDSLMSP